jgi:hypothetical protein
MWVCLSWNALCILSTWLASSDDGGGKSSHMHPRYIVLPLAHRFAKQFSIPDETHRLFCVVLGGMQTVWASVYLVMGIPGAWNLWYIRIYEGTRDDSTRKWLMFFINFVVSHCWV